MADRMGVLRRVLSNRWLRRVELAFLAFGLAEYGVWVSVLVYAFKRCGTTASALVAVVQLLPASIVGPVGALLVERYGPARALRIGLGTARRLDRTTATFAREGEWGGHFYLVNTGSLEVSAAGQRIRTLHPGDGFGEIALLRHGQWTATVTALEATELYELDCDPFLEALTGSRRALQAAAALVLERLEGDRARIFS